MISFVTGYFVLGVIFLLAQLYLNDQVQDAIMEVYDCEDAVYSARMLANVICFTLLFWALLAIIFLIKHGYRGIKKGYEILRRW